MNIRDILLRVYAMFIRFCNNLYYYFIILPIKRYRNEFQANYNCFRFSVPDIILFLPE